jgi:hypothetical protein
MGTEKLIYVQVYDYRPVARTEGLNACRFPHSGNFKVNKTALALRALFLVYEMSELELNKVRMQAIEELLVLLNNNWPEKGSMRDTYGHCLNDVKFIIENLKSDMPDMNTRTTNPH